jgi:hypothetical protein
VTLLDRPNYPTQEQAAAAATSELHDVGDEVYLHERHCLFFEDGCICKPTVMVLTAEGWRYQEQA